MDRRASAKEKTERACALLARLRVGHLAERKPKTFSGGEAQRVALARALAMTPHVVLLDEPFSAMDRDLRSELAADVRHLAEDLRVPFVHVTHHRGEARALGDRAVLVERGQVTRKGTIAEVLGDEDDDVLRPAHNGRGRR
jgi:ABC-type Fe3+/spermidine/putrescine transport system ATPase subunit